MPLTDPDDWIAQQSGKTNVVAKAVAPVAVSNDTSDAGGGVTDVDEWLKAQAQSSTNAPGNVQSLNNTPMAKPNVNPRPWQGVLADAVSKLIGDPSGLGLAGITKAFSNPIANLDQAVTGATDQQMQQPVINTPTAGASANPVVGGVTDFVHSIVGALSTPDMMSQLALGVGSETAMKVVTAPFIAQMALDAPEQAADVGRKLGQGDKRGAVAALAQYVTDIAAPAGVALEKAPVSPAQELGKAFNEQQKGGVREQSFTDEAGAQYKAPTKEAGEVLQERPTLPQPSIPASELSSKAIAQGLPGYVYKPGEQPALGELWRQKVQELGRPLVQASSDVAPVVKEATEDLRGKVSFGSEAQPGAVPSARQLEAKPIEQEGEQAQLMRGSFMPSEKKPDTLVPALRSPSGTIYQGDKGVTHNDIRMTEAKKGNDDVVQQNVEHGFVNVNEPSKFLTREQASEVVGVKEPLHSETLREMQGVQPKEQAQEAPRSATQRRQDLLLDVSKQEAVRKATEPSAVKEGDDFPAVVRQPEQQAQQSRSLQQEKTPEFKNWFKDSQVVDETGAPKVVYHATYNAGKFEKFSTEKEGAHFGTAGQANAIVKPHIEDDVDLTDRHGIIPVYLNIKKLKRVKDAQDDWENVITQAKKEGYDGLVYKNEYEKDADNPNSDSYVAFYPNQIKPAFGKPSDFNVQEEQQQFTGSTQVELPRNSIVISQNFFADNRPNKTWRDELKANVGYLAGKTTPRTKAVDSDVGEQLIKYGSSRITAPALGKAMASRVLGDKWNDVEFSKKLGAVLTQDRLDALRQTHLDQQDPEQAEQVKNVWDQTDSPFKSREEYMQALKDPAIKAAVERHKVDVQPLATAQHVETGGKIARSGEQTSAFVNLSAMHGEGVEGEAGAGEAVEPVKSLIYGSRQGDLTNPLKKGSIFSKQAKGTAQAYDLDYRHIAERMVRGNYEQAQLRKLYDLYLRKGLAIEERPGVEPPEIQGQASVKVPIEVRATPWGTMQRKNLWVRKDLAPELQMALQTDNPLPKTWVNYGAGLLNDMQLVGPTDVTIHLGNMLGAIQSSQGGLNMFHDIMRGIPGVRGLDAIARVSYNWYHLQLDTPEVQEAIAKYSEIGAGRSVTERPSAISRVAGKVLPENVTALIDKYTNTGKLIKTIDTAGRLTMNQMFNSLVERDMAKDTPENRREFINKLGQYNARLRGKYDSIFRESGAAPFIVAGKNFNRLATQQLLFDPGFQAANPQALLKSRLVHALSLSTTLAALPFTANYFITGSIYGRKGYNIPVGTIDTGKDDKDGNAIVFDLAHGNFIRRALRINGVAGGEKAIEQQQTTDKVVERAATQMLEGYLGPFAGPPVSALYTGMTGKNLRTGMTVSENPYSLGENVKAAFTQLNPTFAAAYKGWHDEQSGKKKDTTAEELGQLRRAVGVSQAPPKSLVQKEHEAGVESMSLAKRARVLEGLERQSKVLGTSEQALEARGEGGSRNLYHDIDNLREVQNGLTKDTREFVSSNQLRLPTYEEKIHLAAQGGQKGRDVTLLPKERVQLQRIMTQEYQRSLNSLKDDSYFKGLDQEDKQKAVSTVISKAHKRAKERMEEQLSPR